MDKQTAGYMAQQARNDWPAPHWRKLAESGFLHALLGRPVGDVQRAMAYAILALLDAQPGSSRHRLFRGWYCCSLEHTTQESLPGDDLPDFEFLVEVATERGLDLVVVFRRLYDFLQTEGSDCRPLWRRANDLPWPRTPDILTIGEAATVIGKSTTWLRDQIARGLVPVTPIGRYYLLRRGDLPQSV